MKPDPAAEYVLTVGSLFSGIGGIDLGLERAGMRTIWQVESNPFCAEVLAARWPAVPNLGDVREIDWSEVERPDVVAGGFPCQPVSTAGRRKAQEDERWLWPEFARCLRSLLPDYVIVENVRGLLQRGLSDVLGDLAELGFDAEWGLLPAAAVGAPHLRHRVFVVAYAQRLQLWDQPGRRSGANGAGAALTGDDGPDGWLADTDGERLEERRVHAEGRQLVAHVAGSDGRRLFASEPEPSSWWEVEPEVGRVAYGLPAGVARGQLQALGNAVVPQVAEYVGRRLMAAQIDGSGAGGSMDA